MYASRKEIREAIQTLRTAGSTAAFSAAGCSFDIAKTTAIALLQQRIDIAKEGPIHDLPSFYVSIQHWEYGTVVYINAGSEGSG